jgi:cyclase
MKGRTMTLHHQRIAPLLVIVTLFVCAPAPAQHISGAGREIQKTVIADGIYQFTVARDSYVRQLNSVVIVNEHDVIVFDTDTRPSSARLILAEIRKITDKPVRYVVNSHWHPDHWSGNEVYADAFPSADIIATAYTRDIMRNVASAWPRKFEAELKRREAALAADQQSTEEQKRVDAEDTRDYASFVDEAKTLRRTYPTLTYDDSLTLHHGGREFRFMSVTGDAEGTTVLYLPNERVLITGDAVSYPIPYVTPPPSRQLKTLKMLAGLDVAVIIPGHGPAFRDKTFLNLEAALIESVITGVRRALQQGMLTLDEVANAVTAEELREAFTHNDPDLDQRYRQRVRDLIKVAIREARDGQDYQ